MQDVSQTLWYPLHARAIASVQHLDLNFKDSISVAVSQQNKNIGDSLFLNREVIESLTERTKVMDRAVRNFLDTNDECAVINLGAGLCTRAYRFSKHANLLNWIDIDFPEVITLRRKYLPNHPKIINYADTEIAVTNWLNILEPSTYKHLLVIMEGVATYLTRNQLQLLFKKMALSSNERKKPYRLLMDYCHPEFDYSEVEFCMKNSQRIIFKSGFKNPQDLRELEENCTVVKTYRLPINIESTPFVRKFRIENQGESPYQITAFGFSNVRNSSIKTTFQYFGKNLVWNPEWSHYFLSDGNCFFQSSDSSLMYGYDQFVLLESFLLDAGSVKSQDELMATYYVEQMLSARVLLKKDNEYSGYTPPNSIWKIVEGEHYTGHLLSAIQELRMCHQLLDQLSWYKHTQVLIVDDYLHPEVEKLASELLIKGEDLLLLKLSPQKNFIGPYITNGEDQFKNFIQCLSQNQPARVWAQKHTREPISFPIPIANKLEEKHIIKLTNVISEFIKKKQCNIFMEFDLNTTTSKDHLFNNYIAESSSFSEEPIKNMLQLDGGYRMLSAAETLKRLTPIIDDLTGVIAPPRKVSTQATGLCVYTSSFCIIPVAAPNGIIRHSLGKGMTKIESKVSALSEAIERFCSSFHGTEEVIVSNPHELSGEKLLPQQLKPYSSAQYKRFENLSEERQRVLPLPENQTLHWVKVKSLIDQEEKYLPASFCYSNTPFPDEQYIRFDSNGCAAGNTINEAILQGFFELIERDAIAVWWYNKIQRPGVSLKDLPKAAIEKIDQTLQEDWKYWVLDLTTDFNIPVRCAVGKHRESGEFRLGFGAHLEEPIASMRALTELHQVIVASHTGKGVFAFENILSEDYLFPKSTPVDQNSRTNTPINQLNDALKYCLNQAEKLGFDVLVKNTSRTNIPLKTVKVAIPGLCFIWPEFGNKRLYQLPVDLGWKMVPLNEIELNTLKLFL